jgi:hypothetical protein
LVGAQDFAGYVAWMGEMKNAYKILVEEPEGKRPCRRHRCGWWNNIKMDLKEVWFGGFDWVPLAQGRV